MSPLRSDRCTISDIAALHENAAGFKLGYRADLDTINVIRPIGQLSDKINSIFDSQSIRGHRIKFVISGISIGGIATFQGFEILKWTNDGLTKD